MNLSEIEGSVYCRGRTTIAMLFVSTALLLLSGCSTNDNRDLRDKINAIKAKPATKIPGLPVVKPYVKFLYSAKPEQDPFRYLGTDLADGSEDRPAMKAPEIRNPEALEEYPLDTLRYVGQMVKDGRDWAIITSPDMVVHRVKLGNHLGQNYGKIVEIQESKILLIEKTFDEFSGKWIEREAALGLSE